MTIRLTVDSDLCQGTGECLALAPTAIVLDSIGVARIADDARFEDDIAAKLVMICPSMAIAAQPD